MFKMTITGQQSDFANSTKFPIKCPKCGRESEHLLSALKDDPLITCPDCGQKIKLESGGTAQQAFDEIANLDRAFNNLLK